MKSIEKVFFVLFFLVAALVFISGCETQDAYLTCKAENGKLQETVTKMETENEKLQETITKKEKETSIAEEFAEEAFKAFQEKHVELVMCKKRLAELEEKINKPHEPAPTQDQEVSQQVQEVEPKSKRSTKKSNLDIKKGVEQLRAMQKQAAEQIKARDANKNTANESTEKKTE